MTGRTDPAGRPHLTTAVLVRPDGHVVWTGADPLGARTALRRWFGPPRPASSADPGPSTTPGPSGPADT
ncbi:aromatic-ring hydroxylase C-terminal domain-containing protein [Streptacidiphilus sp. PAMC 29251]